MSYLLDTNVISELRKGARCDEHVARWFADLDDADIFLSVLTIGELRRGIERMRRRDTSSAAVLDEWLGQVLASHRERVLGIDRLVAEAWGRMNAGDPVPVIDGLLAATARVHDLVLATRNVRDVERTGVALVNPFEA